MSKPQNKPTLDELGRLIYEVRSHRVMLDSDLAAIYGVETKALNRAVKRNAIDSRRILSFSFHPANGKT
jgi:ORF6N domain